MAVRCWRSLVPRLGKGSWTFWRDLHACVAVWFSLLIVLFLFTALPWTSFWGSKVLQPLQRMTGQGAPAAAGFRRRCSRVPAQPVATAACRRCWNSRARAD